MSVAEEEFKVFISAKDGPFTPEGAAFWKDGGFRSVRKNNKIRKTLLSGTPLWLRSSSGVFEKLRTFSWPRASHDPVIEKITRGLYYHHFGKILQPTIDVEITFLSKLDPGLVGIARSLIQGNVGGVDRFAYLFGAATEDPEVSFWLYQFYSRHWAAAVTKPAVADIAVDTDVDHWGMRAREMAEAAGGQCDASNVDDWLSASEPSELRDWGAQNPELKAELRRLARDRAIH